MIRAIALLPLASGLFGQAPSLSSEDLIDRAEAEMKQGYLREATASLEAGCRTPAEGVHAARCSHDRGLLHQLQAQYSVAESWYRAAIESLERAHPSDEQLLATTLHNLGEIYGQAGRWEDAHKALTTALAMRRKIYGEHPLTASTLGQLAMVSLGIGNVALAERLLQSALSTHETLLPPTDPKRLASAHNFAQLRIARGEYREAIELLQGVLRLFDKANAPSPSVSHASVCGSLASVLLVAQRRPIRNGRRRYRNVRGNGEPIARDQRRSVEFPLTGTLIPF